MATKATTQHTETVTVLGTVIVRFCEDNALVRPAWLAGPDTRPERDVRDMLRDAFGYFQRLPAARSLFGQHNPLWSLEPSADAAARLVRFWRQTDLDGRPIHDLADPELGTGFLADLYQNLSEPARKAHALVQTPEFVADLILDLTLNPAVDEFGHDEVRVIDPVCGSGEFLLGAFRRLMDRWDSAAPEIPTELRVERVLDAVHGIDLDPFAATIARFRLLIAALRAAGLRSLESAPGGWRLNIAVGDALLGPEGPLRAQVVPRDGGLQTEDLPEYVDVIRSGSYHVVVGNPPHLVVRDRRLDLRYRERYDAASGKYALTVPFTQRFYEFARRGDREGHGAGYVGQLLANSFTKRTFGRALIEKFLATRVTLTHVIDTSGAYVPGHVLPTVILAGRNRAPSEEEPVFTVLSLRGEPEVPADPRRGAVWESILRQARKVDRSDGWTQSLHLDRERLRSFPWKLTGDQASAALSKISGAPLKDGVRRIGYYASTGADGIFIAPRPSFQRLGVENHDALVGVITGSEVRDWRAVPELKGFFPRDHDRRQVDITRFPRHLLRLWPYRTVLGNRANHTTRSYFQDGRHWYDWHHVTARKRARPWAIVFAWVATHNHCAILRDQVAPLQSAPIVVLGDDATERDHVELVALLNSSTVCFWLKQQSQSKGAPSAQQTSGGEPWATSYEFTATRLGELPVPAVRPTRYAAELDRLARKLDAVTPAAVLATDAPSSERLTAAHHEWKTLRSKLIALQEELDWEVYRLYGLLAEDLTVPADSLPQLQLGERAFEIVLARRMAAGEIETEWFARHGSSPTTEIPEHWPESYRILVERRLEVIENDPSIGLIERPEYKRRWASEGWESQRERGLRDWLLDRCERRDLWYVEEDGIEQPRPTTATQLAQKLRRDPDAITAAELYAPGRDFTKVIQDLLAGEHVPCLAALQYKDSGLAKRSQWEQVWDLQRQEDAATNGEQRAKIREQLPVPPLYRPSDFRTPRYWRHRGKHDVPNERFISYPDADPGWEHSLLLGWAGWDHLERAQALAGLIREWGVEAGGSRDRLVPLLAGLREALPWVRQWHTESDPAEGATPAEHYDAFLTSSLERLGLDQEALTAWRPPPPRRGRPRKPRPHQLG